MRKIIVISLLFTFLLSCSKSPDLTGTWIEINNFNNPAVFKYWEGKFYQFDGIYQDTVSYKVDKNKIIYEKHGIASFKLINDTLSFTFDSISYPLKFERLKYETYDDYLLNKLDVSLVLPTANANQIKYRSYNNFVTLSKEGDSIKFSFNGEFYELENFKLDYDEFKWQFKTNLFYIDSNIFMESINELEQVFQELNLPKIVYVTNPPRTGGVIEINGFYNFLSTYSVKYNRLVYKSGQGESKIPPPPEATLEDLIEKKYKCYSFNQNKILVNDSEIDLHDFLNEIKQSILKDKGFVLSYHVDKSSNYSKFIEIMAKLNEPYDEIRDSISIKVFENSYAELSEDEKREIRKKYPKRIKRLNDKEFALMNNNP